jgi:hypothetical protein
MRRAGVIFGAFAVACAGAQSTTAADNATLNQSVDSVQTNGPLRLEMHDAPLTPSNSAFDTIPKFADASGAVTIARAQIGSLCRHALTGTADTQGDKIGVHIVFTERLTTCTAEVRVLRYDATVSASPGTYRVALIHERNGIADTVARQSVIVR